MVHPLFQTDVRHLSHSVEFLGFYWTQILLEIDFGHIEAPKKTSFLTTLSALNFVFLGIFDIFKCEILHKS